MSKKITKAEAAVLAMTALQRGNPYIEKSVVFQIDKSDRYLYADKIFTKEEIDKAYYETALHDVKAGFGERMAGYYDKWYRYTRADNGRAYDIGAAYAANTGRCGNNFTIIPCMS